MRPAQWVKNVFVLAALIFGVRPDDPDALHKLWLALGAFGVFCMLASSVYAFNDLIDFREDALHPMKRNRPVASGAISPLGAGLIAIMLAVAGCWAATQFPRGFALTAV